MPPPYACLWAECTVDWSALGPILIVVAVALLIGGGLIWWASK